MAGTCNYAPWMNLDIFFIFIIIMAFEIKKSKQRHFDTRLVDMELFEYVMKYYYEFTQSKFTKNDLESVRVDTYLGKTSFGKKYDKENLKKIKESHKLSVLETPFLSGIMNIIQKRILDTLPINNIDVFVLSSSISWGETLKLYSCKTINNYVLPARTTHYTEHQKLLDSTVNTYGYESLIADKNKYELMILDIFYLYFEDSDCEKNFQFNDCFKYARNNYINHNDFLLKQVDFALQHMHKEGNLILMIPGVTNIYTLNIIQLIRKCFSSMVILDDQQLLHRDKIIFSTTIMFKAFKFYERLPLKVIYEMPKKKEKLPHFARDCQFTCTKVPTISFLDSKQYLEDFYQYNNQCLIQLYDMLCKAYIKHPNMTKYYAIYLANSLNLPVKKKYGLSFFKELLVTCLTNETMKFEFEGELTANDEENIKKDILLKKIQMYSNVFKYFDISYNFNDLINATQVSTFADGDNKKITPEFFQLKEIQKTFNKDAKVITLSLEKLSDKKTFDKIIKLIATFKYVKFYAPTYPVTHDTFFVILEHQTKSRRPMTDASVNILNSFFSKFIQYLNFKKTNKLFLNRDFLNNNLELWQKLQDLRKQNHEAWIYKYL